MSRIAFNGNALGTGTVTIASPNTNSDRTVTLPDETGTVVLGGGALGTPSSGNGSNLTNLNASNLASGTVPDARFPATLPAASGANLTALNGTNISSGTVAVARLAATGTPSASTFLRGDSSWAVAGGDPTTAQVLSATAGASVGAVGTYAFLAPPDQAPAATYNPGNTAAGSSLRYSGARTSNNGGGITTNIAPSGTWRCMGFSRVFNLCCVGYVTFVSVWLRIS